MTKKLVVHRHIVIAFGPRAARGPSGCGCCPWTERTVRDGSTTSTSVEWTGTLTSSIDPHVVAHSVPVTTLVDGLATDCSKKK